MRRHDRQPIGGTRELRTRLAQETARIVAEHGIDDRRRALGKAMQRLGISDPAAIPDRDEIEQAIGEQQRLFGSDQQPDTLQTLRQTALEAMKFLSAFEPRLVGAVLDGSAGPHSPVHLHLFSDDPDAVTRYLQDQRIPHRTAERRLRLQHDRSESFPMHAFLADGVELELTVLPLDRVRQAPLDPDSDRPMPRASQAMVRALL